MFTPQQIEQISFNRATFGGYDMQAVDEFLEPLTEDYITLYKENALLKSKMRVLVGKLEEYRKNEASMENQCNKTCKSHLYSARKQSDKEIDYSKHYHSKEEKVVCNRAKGNGERKHAAAVFGNK